MIWTVLNCFDYHSGNDQFSWLYTSRENLTLLPPNSKVAGQNTHLRSLIIAYIFRYLLTCETARPKNAAFRQGLHCSRTLLNKFNIPSDDQTAKVVQTHLRVSMQESDFLATVIKFIMKCRAWSRSTLFAIQAVTPHSLVRIAYRRVIILLFKSGSSLFAFRWFL